MVSMTIAKVFHVAELRDTLWLIDAGYASYSELQTKQWCISV